MVGYFCLSACCPLNFIYCLHCCCCLESFLIQLQRYLLSIYLTICDMVYIIFSGPPSLCASNLDKYTVRRRIKLALTWSIVLSSSSWWQWFGIYLNSSHLLCAAVGIRNRCRSIVNQIVATKLKHRGPAQLHVDVPLESYCMAALFSPRITFTVMLSGSESGRNVKVSTKKKMTK